MYGLFDIPGIQDGLGRAGELMNSFVAGEQTREAWQLPIIERPFSL